MSPPLCARRWASEKCSSRGGCGGGGGGGVDGGSYGIFRFLLENRSPSSCKLKPLCVCCIVQNCPYFYAGEYK